MNDQADNSSESSSVQFDIEQIELKGFSRSIAEIEWLLLLLVILYYVSPQAQIEEPLAVLISIEVFTAFVLGFHYINYDAPQYRWKLALETWVMIAFITWVLWNTGSVDSPLLNLYFLVIISSAITLGKVITFLEIALIGSFYFFLASRTNVTYEFNDFTELMSFFAPFVLVAYITTMLASDVNSGKKMFKTLSETDEMTNLLNKRSFSPLFNKAAEVAEKYSHPLSAMMIDADNLKAINDAYGHKAGDKLILTVATTIQDCLRTSDIICRYGGDEFVAVLPQIPANRALEVGERIRRAVEAQVFHAGGKKLSSTISVGIATYPDDVSNVNDLLEKADEMLYECKESGRNKVISYSSQSQPNLDLIENKQNSRLRKADEVSA
jgi:diguanylate cyclase (GGDEF)-like protein